MQLLIRIVAYAFNLLEFVLALRFFLRMAGANAANAVVAFLYTVSGVFLTPFHAVFPPSTVAGSVVEWSTLFAMAIYAFLAYAALHFLLIIRSGDAPLENNEVRMLNE